MDRFQFFEKLIHYKNEFKTIRIGVDLENPQDVSVDIIVHPLVEIHPETTENIETLVEAAAIHGGVYTNDVVVDLTQLENVPIENVPIFEEEEVLVSESEEESDSELLISSSQNFISNSPDYSYVSSIDDEKEEEEKEEEKEEEEKEKIDYFRYTKCKKTFWRMDKPFGSDDEEESDDPTDNETCPLSLIPTTLKRKKFITEEKEEAERLFKRPFIPTQPLTEKDE
jgi:hypothetical protein